MATKPSIIIDEEVSFEDEKLDARCLITRTDLRGIITYSSLSYRKMTKYSKEDLLGKPHSIVRHPDMPKAAFKSMWNTINNDIAWEGYVKNLRKDGKYYWVIVRIEPIFDEDGNKIGYVGIRREPSREAIKMIIKKYRYMLENE